MELAESLLQDKGFNRFHMETADGAVNLAHAFTGSIAPKGVGVACQRVGGKVR
jgi:hypothetical protein